MPGPDGTIDSAGPLALRRLTLLEYQNTVRDLLGVTLTDADRRGFSNDQVVHGGFGSGAAIVTSTDSRQFLDTSGKVAAAAVGNLGKLMPDGCAAPAAGQEEACIDKFIDGFGLRAFRRPVTAAEKTALKALYTKLRSPDVGAPFNEAVHDLLLAIIQSPEFLYRWELDGQPIKDGDLIRLGPYEIASRLSYLIWASMPDDTLFEAAKAGQLSNPDQIAEQARRLLKDDRAKEGLRDFYMQWLSMYGVDELEKDPIFPTYTPEVAKAMLGEASAFVGETLFAQGGKLEALLTSTASFLNEPLAKHYGVQGITGTDLRKVELNPAQRAGILTRGAFLARHSKEVDSFPIMRGLQVLHQVLCQVVPEPTIMLPPPPEQQKGVTTRKLYEDFTKDAACQVCHTRINGVGFAFEHYDASGAYRDTEENQPIDASGKLELASGTISFKNAIDFSQQIAKTPEARDCLSRNWLRFLLRREESKLEGGSLKAVNQAFEASNYDMRELIVSLTKTRAFTHRNPDAAAGK
jgi:Protein of unknown function (DUF1592)/Protein of unknown function (DUF1588)/Protein of unknown function (DUF1595)/Protein of unknown function (DUF1585)/Protein of unknown function (DUF1587)